jgi:serine protease
LTRFGDFFYAEAMAMTEDQKLAGFIVGILLVAGAANIGFLTSELGHQSHQTSQPRVLGLDTNLPTQAVPNRLLVKFKSDPKIRYSAGFSLTIPFTSLKVVLQKPGFRSQTYQTLNSTLETMPLTNTKALFNYKNSQSVYLFSYQGGANLDNLKNQLQNQSSVEAVDYDHYLKAQFTPNDPDYRHADQLLQWNLDQAAFPAAWDILNETGTPQNTIGVAVLDTGLAYEDYTETNHPSFCLDCRLIGKEIDCPTNDKVACIDPGAQYSRHLDLDNVQILPGLDLFDDPTQTTEHPNDDNGHGTHVASIISQTTNNANRFSGCANLSGQNRIALMPIKVLDRNGMGVESDVIAGFQYIQTYNASGNNSVKVRVANISLGTDQPNPILEQAINDLYQSGVILIASSGNTAGSNLLYPAGYQNVVAVGATKTDRSRAYYSNYGPGLDLVAPGGQTFTDGCFSTNTTDLCDYLDQDANQFPDGIFQTTIVAYPEFDWQTNQKDFTVFSQPDNSNEFCRGTTGPKDSCGLEQGTSMAAPHVSALASLILSINPSLNPETVSNILNTTADKNLPDYNLTTCGNGLINSQSALVTALNSLPTSTPTPSEEEPTPTVDPTEPTPTETPPGSPTPTPTDSDTNHCGDGLCQPDSETVKTCYADCCSVSAKLGDLNHDCVINSADWSNMWSHWSDAGVL